SATNDVNRAMQNQDAIIVTLGINESPFRVRLFGPKNTPLNVRSAGTENVILAMKKYGVRKLGVQTSYGVGDTKDKLGFVDKLLFRLLLKPQIADTERQEKIVRESALDWIIARPVHLTDDASDKIPFTSIDGKTSNKMKVSRNSVGRFWAEALQSGTWIH